MRIASSAAVAAGMPSPKAVFLISCSRAVQLPVRSKLKLIGKKKSGRRNVCRAELARDAPYAAAIGACVLSSLVAPLLSDDAAITTMDSTDARFAVMGIIALIPYFNWLSWVFAWLDADAPRYLLYSVVYLAPYFSCCKKKLIRTNLSLSPDESWLPISSILVCIVHIQLEASIRSGDLNSSALCNEALKFVFPFFGKKHSLRINEKSSESESKCKQPSSSASGEWRIPTKQTEGSGNAITGEEDNQLDSMHE